MPQMAPGIDSNAGKQGPTEIPSTIFNTIKALQQNSTSPSLPENWDEFQKRTATYTKLCSGVPVWLLKPMPLVPTICAQYGWECIGIDLLKCVTCHSALSAKLPKVWNTKVYQECVKEVVKCLKSAHKKHCPWPLAPSPDSFVRFIPVHKSQAFNEFLCRLERLLSIGSALPVVDDSVMIEMKLSADDLENLCQVAHRTYDDVTKSAMLLSALGWNKGPVQSTEKQRYLVCGHCHRRIGLWFYSCYSAVSTVTKEHTSYLDHVPEGEESSQQLSSDGSVLNAQNDEQKFKKTEGQPQRKKLKTSEMEKSIFNPLKEHQRWCPWVISINSNESCISESQGISMNSSLPGWQIHLNCLKRNLESPAASPKNTPVSKQNLTRARKLLDSWTSDVEPVDGHLKKMNT